MQVLVDMNLSPGWVGFLAEAGFEAVHWSEVGAANASDSELMQWAVERGFVVLTADLDFGAILAAAHSRRPSVVQLRSDILTPRAIGGAVVAAIRQTRDELLHGALVSVDMARARLRTLPLRAQEQT
jgi:predicted nuclease of predicted toxin-antitoxin system